MYYSSDDQIKIVLGKTTATTKIEEYYLVNEFDEIIENGTYIRDDSFNFIPQ